MGRLDVLGAVVSPSPSHSFGLDMVGHNLAILGKRRLTDCALSVLLDDLSVQQLPHVCRLSDYAECTLPPF